MKRVQRFQGLGRARGCLAFVGATLVVAAVPATAVPNPVVPRAAQASATPESQNIGILLTRLKDPDPAVRGRTADEIHRISDPAAVPALLAALMAADPHDRQLVAGFLEKFKDPRKIEPYVTLLRQCGWECYALAEQLAELGEAALRHLLAASREPCGEESDWLPTALAGFGEPALQPLLAAAKSDEPCQRLRAVTALGSDGYDSKVGTQGYALVWRAVIAGLGDPARPVRLAALDRVSQLTRYLEQIDPPPGLDSALPLLAAMLKTEEDEGVRRTVIEAVAQIGREEAVPTLRAALQDKHERVREAARAALDYLMPPPQQDPFRIATTNLRSPDPALRAEAAGLLGSSNDSAHTQNLVALLRDTKAPVAPATRHNDERARDTSCVPHLIALLRDTDAGVRKAVVVSLTAIFDPAAVPPITAMLKDPSAAVRTAAAQSLGEFAEPQIVRAVPARRSESAKALIAALNDTEAAVIRAAAEALGAFQDIAALEALTIVYRGSNADPSKAAFAAIARICDPSSTPLLLEAVQRPGNVEVSYAVDALTCVLRKKRDPRAVVPLLEVFAATTDPWRGLLDALGATHDGRALEPLARLTKLRDRDLRRYAAQALGALGDSRAAPVLAALVKDPDSGLRLDSAIAFKKLGRFTAPPQLMEALTDEDSGVRSSAAQALAASGDPKAVMALIANVESSEGVLIALGEARDQRAVPALMSFLLDKSKPGFSRGLAARGLGTLGDGRAVEPLVTALDEDDYNVQANAVQALGILGDKRAIEPLQRALERWRDAPRERKNSAIDTFIAEALKKLGVTVPNP